MKNYTTAAFLLITMWTLASYSGESRETLKQRAVREDRWQQAELVNLMTGQVEAQGYFTEVSSFRVEKFLGNQASNANLESSLASDGLTKFKEYCRAAGPYLFLSFDKQRKHAVRFQMPYMAKLEANRFAARLSTGDVRTVRSIEQQMLLRSAQVKIEFDADSYFTRYGSRTLTSVQKNLQSQMPVQINSARRGEDLVFELTGLDDVACDLANNKAKISVSAQVDYQAALIDRTPVITATQLYKIDTLAKAKHKQPTSDLLRGIIITSALLSAALHDELRTFPTEFGMDNFVRLQNLLVDNTIGAFKSATPDQYESLARELDLLSARVVSSNLSVQTKVQGAQ